MWFQNRRAKWRKSERFTQQSKSGTPGQSDVTEEDLLSESEDAKIEDELEVEAVSSSDVTSDADAPAERPPDAIPRESGGNSPEPDCGKSEENTQPSPEDSSDKNAEEITPKQEDKFEERDRSDSVIVPCDVKEEDSEDILRIPKTTQSSSRVPISLPSIFSGMHNMCSSSSLLMNMANQSQDSMLMQKQQFMQPSFVQTLLALNNNVVNRQSVLPFMEG